MITLDDYFHAAEPEGDRRLRFPLAMTPEIEKNVVDLLERVNKLTYLARGAGVDFETHPRTKSYVSSGWRSPEINAATANAAMKSKHMRGLAIDIYDPDGELDDWLMTDDGQRAMTDCILWMEHPSATKNWSHVQSIAPKSGRRVFYP